MRRFKAAARTTKAFVVLLAVLALGSLGVGVIALAAPSVPAPTIISGPANPTNSLSPTFTYTDSSSITRFECALDASIYVTCGTTRPSTKSYPAQSPGLHTFNVRAVSGSLTSSPTAYSWTIDTTAPSVVSINRTTPPGPYTNASSVSWTVTFNEGVTGVDSGDFSLVSSGLLLPLITSTSGSGATYTVTASTGLLGTTGTLGLNLNNNGSIHDLAGNPLGSPTVGHTFAGQVYNIDKVQPPRPVLTYYPDDPNGTAISTFAWTEDTSHEPEGVSFQCSIENGSWQVCSSPITFTVNSANNGLHQFAVRAIDAAGNISETTSYSWKVNNIGFTITGDAPTLYPGVWNKIPVKVTNPNNFTIYITSLTVGVSSSPANCAASNNIETQASAATSSNTFAVPAHATNWLVPAAYHPRIRLKDLPLTNQDLCKSASFNLSYAGTATK